jgi:hypothetical protein
MYDGQERQVHLRVADASGPDGPVCFLDLADERRRAVKITRRMTTMTPMTRFFRG